LNSCQQHASKSKDWWPAVGHDVAACEACRRPSNNGASIRDIFTIFSTGYFENILCKNTADITRLQWAFFQGQFSGFHFPPQRWNFDQKDANQRPKFS
jgi:hypothetical protein